MYSEFLREGGKEKTTPDTTFQTKDPLTTLPRTKTLRTIEREVVQEAFVRNFCTRPTRNGRGPRCVTYFWRIPECVTKCDKGKGSKLTKNSVTYFMDSP